MFFFINFLSILIFVTLFLALVLVSFFSQSKNQVFIEYLIFIKKFMKVFFINNLFLIKFIKIIDLRKTIKKHNYVYRFLTTKKKKILITIIKYT